MTWNVKPGDLVVCVKKGAWRKYVGDKVSPDQIPYGTVCTVDGIEIHDDGVYLAINGWPAAAVVWWIDHFRPVAKPSIEGLRLLLTKPLVTA